MSVRIQQHFVARSAEGVAFDRTVPLRGDAARKNPALRYSSPRPWLLAASISGAMWAGIIWAIWRVL
jgi:hypothetical protein